MTPPSINTGKVICERGSLAVNRYNPQEENDSILYIVNDESELACINISRDGSGLDQFKHQFINFYEAMMGEKSAFIFAEERIINFVVMDTIRTANLLLI